MPGDTVTAMLLGGFMIHGITPGPLLFQNNSVFVYGIFASLIVANILMTVTDFLGLRGFVRILRIPKYYLLPIILALCVVGAYVLNNRVFDVATILIFGLIGYGMEKFGYPLPPIILGFILGPMVEVNLRRGLMYTNGNFLPFLTSPIAALFLIIAVWSSINAAKKNKKRLKLKERGLLRH